MDNFFLSASSIMTVVSLLTFLGILWWTFSARRKDDFAQAELLPFADDAQDDASAGAEQEREHHRG